MLTGLSPAKNGRPVDISDSLTDVEALGHVAQLDRALAVARKSVGWAECVVVNHRPIKDAGSNPAMVDIAKLRGTCPV